MQEPCEELAKAGPKLVPQLLPRILNLIRLIWANSRFYNSAERVTGLLNKVSNEVINRCVSAISLEDLFNGEVEKSREVLEASINAGNQWQALYNRTAERINSRVGALRKWDFDRDAIFSRVEAFVHRCEDLLEVCEGQIQFARKSFGKQTRLPRFGGARGPEIAKRLLDIQVPDSPVCLASLIFCCYCIAAFERQIAVL